MVKYGTLVSLLLFAFAVTFSQPSESILNGFASAKFLPIGNTDHDDSNCKKSVLVIRNIIKSKIQAYHYSNIYKISGKPTSNLSENREHQKYHNEGSASNKSGNKKIAASFEPSQVPDPVIIKTLIFNEENRGLLVDSSVESGPLKKDYLVGIKAHFLIWLNQYMFASKPVKVQNNTGASSKLSNNKTEGSYRQWWPIILLLLICTANLYALCKFRSTQLSKVTALRTKISQDLHDNVGAALSSISMFCHAAIQKNELGDSAGSRQILESIGETSRDIMKDLNESVWLINPINDNLQKIIQRINKYALPLCTTKDIYFEVSATESVQNLDLSVEKRKAIYLFLKEAINNCLKYAAAKNLHIQFIKNRKTLYISIKDDGIGFRADNSFSGNGLNNMKQRSIDIKGAIEVRSMVQRGTEIQFQVPLNNVG